MDNNLKKMRIRLWILVAVTAAVLVAHSINIYIYNSKVHTTHGFDSEEDVFMNLEGRAGSVNTWVKRDYELYGELVDLTGGTSDGVVYNLSEGVLADWTLRININGDCFINQAWNGVVEIHQYTGTDREAVQLYNLQSFTADSLELDYLFDGDLLVPLQAGDYVIYYPNESYKETNIESGEEAKIGFIFYYLDDIDLSDYDLVYTCHREFDTGYLFYIFFILAIVTVAYAAAYNASRAAYRRAIRELELLKSGIGCMSDIYSIIYMITLGTDELVPITADEDSERERPKKLGAREQLLNLFDTDSEDVYREYMLRFGDLSTIAERLADRNTVACEYISRKHGWCRIRFYAMERAEGMPVEKVLFTIQQIGVEKQEMADMQEKVSKAETENRAKSTFLANMSHEIRTPINAVLGFDTMILRKTKDPDIRTYAGQIQSAGNMLLTLINGILDYSKIEAGKMELVPADYSLKTLIYDVENLTRARMEAKRLEFNLEVEPSLPCRLYGDDVRIKQVIINLITNAAKYTNEGSVTLTVSGDHTMDGFKLRVGVRDTGMGIKPEDRVRLLERFARLEENKNRSVEGTGIGLSLVTALLELMDSELEVESTYGEGSDFHFTILQQVTDASPIGLMDASMADQIDYEDSETSFTAPEAQLLVVDDNSMNLSVFSELLDGTEMQIDKATSGPDALKLTQEKEYDIIFMDHMMPEMSGIEAFHEIRKQTEGRNLTTPVIILTANAMSGNREEYEREGFDGYLAKPVKPDELEQAILKFLPADKVTECTRSAVARRPEAQQKLPEIEGVDMAYALEHVGSMAGVETIMKQFVSIAEADAAELSSYWEKLLADESDGAAADSYRIKVHAMKASAALFGALQVYGAAAQLEYAARDRQIRQIVETTPYFLEFWRKLKNNVSSVLGIEAESEGSVDMDSEELNNLLHQLKTSMKAYDIQSADSLMADIAEVKLSEQQRARIEELKAAVSLLDAEKACEICDALMA